MSFGQPIDSMEWILATELVANDYNPNYVPPVEFELIATSLFENGWTIPIVLLEDSNQIVDGFHRVTLVMNNTRIAALTEGHVPCVRISADEAQRMAATVRHNRARGVHQITAMGKIVTRLNELLGEKEVARVLGMDQEEIDRLRIFDGMPNLVGSDVDTFGRGWKPTRTMGSSDKPI